MNKVYTKGQIRNYVRLLVLFLLLSAITISCEDETATDDPRDKIVDTWNCKENGSISGTTSYAVEISKSPSDSTKVFIDNFYGLGPGIKVTAKMNGLSLIISSQTVDGNLISGSGSISSSYKTISWTYKVNDGGGEIDNVTAAYSRIQ
jgi:hypothetical protein